MTLIASPRNAPPSRPRNVLMSLRLNYHSAKRSQVLFQAVFESFAGTFALPAAPISKRDCGLGNTSTSRSQASAHLRGQ